MNIEELRKALASDATEKVKEQERLIKNLRKDISERDERIKVAEDVLRTMFNRCYVQSQGLLCFWCGHSEMCHRLRDVGKEQET